MRTCRFGVAFLAVLAAVAVLSPAEAGGGKKKDGKKPDKVVGVRWEYKLVDAKTKDVENSGTFRAHNGKLFRGGKEIGTYEDVSNTQVKAEVKQGKLKGKWELNLTKPKPNLTWRGELTKDDGSKLKMIVTFLKD